LHGSKTLFQVGLAILRINGEQLLDSTDDGVIISILKNYFSTLDQSAHPNSSNERLRNVSKFQELMVVAFKEFSIINDDVINSIRSKHEEKIFNDIENFAKRTQLRNLIKGKNLKMNQLESIYDCFYYTLTSTNSDNANGIYEGLSKTELNFELYLSFMSRLVDWMNPKWYNKKDDEKQNSEFMRRLFNKWDGSKTGMLSLQDVVSGFDWLVDYDLMSCMNCFFELYQTEGVVDREGILQMSEGLLLLTRPYREGEEALILDPISLNKLQQQKIKLDDANPEDIQVQFQNLVESYRHEQSVRYLSSVSNFIQRAFEYALPCKNDDDNDDDDDDAAAELESKSNEKNIALDPNTPLFLNAATFRMVVLADETLETFFASLWQSSVHFETVVKPTQRVTLRSVFDGLMADGIRVAGEVKKRIDEIDRAVGEEEEDHHVETVNQGDRELLSDVN
jgi:hypothetical protein